ncbi:MAG TPA: hypothetical protein VF368_11055, partial [Gemmatimonadaceae bacterium]
MTADAAAAPTAGPNGEPYAEPRFASDLITLTKPRIISLLLVTTIAPMFVAGTPTWSAVLFVT